MAALDKLKQFDIPSSTVSLWTFKKVTVAGSPPRFVGRWVNTTNELDDALKAAVAEERNRITEVQEYSLLAETNESSALSIATLETHAGLIVVQAAAETPTLKTRGVRDLKNTAFYVVKLAHQSDIIHAVRKTDASWRAKTAANLISVLFSDNQLDLDQDAGFNISKNIDFFIVGTDILISKKMNFESVLSFKAAHQEDFIALQSEPEFREVFTSMEALLTYVGENKIQLRRIAAIRQKGHYRDPDFMRKLKQNYARFGLNLEFDADGKLVPSMERCRDIFQALLDHRLLSGFSDNVYDVQDAAPIRT